MTNKLFLTLETGFAFESYTVTVYQTPQGIFTRDAEGLLPFAPGELTTKGYSSSGSGYGTYDYVTGQHTADRRVAA
jgi:hypothetical protein